MQKIAGAELHLQAPNIVSERWRQSVRKRHFHLAQHLSDNQSLTSSEFSISVFHVPQLVYIEWR